MATFFNDIDAIYCLCVEDRKAFVIEQFTNLGIIDKVKIVKAYTRDSQLVHKIISDHLVYPIYTDNLVSIACTLGVQTIMLDIVKNKFNYAMVIEDDVIFMESKFNHGNTWIRRDIINNYINISKPYVLYLQSSAKENIYYNQSNCGTEGIIISSVRYGEPAYITNHLSCSILLKHLFPITSPFDEYKFLVKKKYGICEAILVPYICSELSANHNNYDKTMMNHSFKRTFLSEKKSLFEVLITQKFYIATNRISGQDKLLVHLINGINPNIKIILNEPKINNKMFYCVGNYTTSIDNAYIIGSTIDYTINKPTNPSFIISVRGSNSFNIIKKKFGITPLIGDMFLLFSKYHQKITNNKYKYCFIYDNMDLIITGNYSCIFINPSKVSADQILDTICSSEYIVSNDINYLTIGNSYEIPGVFAVLANNINKYYYVIAQDYYSNITDANVLPIIIPKKYKTNILNIDNEFNRKAENFVQPLFHKNIETVNNLIDTLPFILNMHRSLSKGKKYTQFFI